MNNLNIKPAYGETIQQRLDRIRAQRATALQTLKPAPLQPLIEDAAEQIPQQLQTFLASSKRTEQIRIPNEDQNRAIQLALSGKTFCLTGAAGTGKTFTTQSLCEQMLAKPHSIFRFSTKYLMAGAPAIVLTGFTRRSVRNAQDAIANDQITCVNYHKLIEFEPVYYDIWDEKEQKYNKTMRFEPKYNKLNKLPHIQTILIDETSQFSIDMFQTLCDALPDPERTQFIFIGDIHQIPPTMGRSIYLPKLISEPSIELTKVYRQALKSPIIRFLTDLRSGHTITRNKWKSYSRLPSGERNNKMNFGTFPPNLDWEGALIQAASFLRHEFQNGNYNPYDDMVLVPFNTKKFGTDRLNKEISHFLDRTEDRTVYPVLCGWIKKHFAIGDHVIYETQDYVIKEIKRNEKYTGLPPNPPSKFIDREGSVFDRIAYNEEQSIKELYGFSLDTGDIDEENAGPRQLSDEELEEFIKSQIGQGQEEKYNAASHKLILESLDDPSLPELVLSSTGELQKTILSYAITVHKAQGLQANRVYFFLHKSHSPMHYQELIYTAASRAKEYLTIICDPKYLERGSKIQRIKGNNLQEKIAFLRGSNNDFNINETENERNSND